MNTRHILFFLSCFLFASALSAAENIPLYASPSTDWDPILVADARSSQIRKGLPVENQTTETADGWYHTTYASRYTGYALASEASLNPLPVHLSKDEDSPIIAKLTPKVRAKKVNQGEWIEVTFKQPIDVYFQKGTSFDRPTRPSAAKETAKDSIPPLHVFEGKLKIKDGFFGIEPRYRYELLDSKNKLIGYINADNLVSSAPMSGYIDKYVLIQGTVFPSNNTLIINAKTLQLKNAGI